MQELWKELEYEIRNCKKCLLCTNRKNVVIGEGDLKANIMFIAEAPGEEEDKEGRPFVGKSGNLLTKILNSVGLSREEVYMTNVVKCHPMNNRNPNIEEVESCYPFLETQIALVNPKLIVTIGAVSTKYILKNRLTPDMKITKIRGQEFEWEGGIKVIPILHPSYLLRNSSTSEGSPKWNTWQDMKKIKEKFDMWRIENR
ncbi:MAG: uracil-DNA glycosylase [Fusobacteriia bacterium 4572_132]|nr:MAG: uracil-DNA glycosylase [Fusobacteriia bacterium 4572_132]